MTRTWTPQQEAIITEMATGRDNLICNAVAGSGKTTTIVEGAIAHAEAHPHHRILLCAFNKRIAVELEERIALAGKEQIIQCKTFNGIGHGAWGKTIGSFAKVDTKKTWSILRQYIKEDGEFPDAARLISILKASGWLPPLWRERLHVHTEESDQMVISEIIDDFELDCTTKQDIVQIAEDTMLRSIEMSYEGLIDFDDQLYMPTLFSGVFPSYSLVVVDEVQDVSWIQRKMIRKLLGPTARVIGVGDRNQAIYAFRGAGYGSMDSFKEYFKCSELPLSVSFRCPRLVVERAQQYVPQIEACAGALEGSITTNDDLPMDKESLPPTAVVLCRNNKPLVPMCFEAIKSGIPAKLLGRDIGEGLAALVRKAGKGHKNVESLLAALQKWADQRQRDLLGKDKEAQAASLLDRVETIMAIAEDLDPLSAPSKIEDKIRLMFSDDTSRLTFSTIHKAKGLEWDRVVILDFDLIPSKWAKSPDAIQQEHNCAYVAVTRARKELIFTRSRKR